MFGQQTLTGLNGLGSFLLFLFYGAASIPTTYAFTFAFEKSTSLQIALSMIYGAWLLLLVSVSLRVAWFELI